MNKSLCRKLILAIFLCCFLLTGCSSKIEEKNINSLSDLKDMKLNIGRSMSIDMDERIHELCPNEGEPLYMEASEALNGLKSSKIDAYVAGDNFLNNMVETSDLGLKIIDEPIETYRIGFAISKSSAIPELEKRVNEFVAEGRKKGEFEEIYNRWQQEDYDERMEDIPHAENPDFTLVVGTVGFNKPYCYYKNNELVGADIEIAYKLAKYLNADIRFEDSNYDGILAGLSAGKYDILAANLYILDGRKDAVLFSDPYYDINIRALVKDSSSKNKPTLKSLEGKKAGVLTGTPHESMINAVVDNVKFDYYNSFSDMGLALEQGKIDFFVNNDVAIGLMQEEYPDFIMTDEAVTTFDVGTIFQKNADNQLLIQQYNEYIGKIKADGTLEKKVNYWLEQYDCEKLDIEKTGENGTLTLATCTSAKPFSMMIDGEYAGFDIDIVNEFCKVYGYGLKIEDCDFAGMLAGISNGKYDMAAGQIAYTPERAESVIYSDFYYNQKIVAVVKNGSIESKKTFQQNIKSGFKKTFVDEDRYKMILYGIWVTLVITIFGFLLANILGAIICAMAMSKIKLLIAAANIYSKVMQGTPIVVVLMIIYYVIFGNSSISNVLVAIIGFGISTAANVAQVYEGAIEQVNKGEIEAALALGFSKTGSFLGIVLPQAIRHMIPALGSQLVGLMKGTAVVGYIAVMDMTKVSDIIRSSTYEALFPLLSIAVIYFAISTVILLIFDRIRYCMNPENRERNIKGV